MIKTDFGSAKIADFAEGGRKCQFVFTCEHSTNKLPTDMDWGKDHELKDQHWACDIGALDLAFYLAKYYKTFLVYPEYSRLLLDVNRVVVSKSMFREEIEKDKPVHFNQNLSIDDQAERMRKFFIPFYQALSSQGLTLEEVVNKVDYTYTFSIHSFSVKEEPTLKNLEVGILHNLFDDLANFFLKEFESLGYVAMINQPYDGKQGGNHSQNNSIGFEVNPNRQGILFEFRNDILQSPERSAKLRDDFVSILNKLSKPAATLEVSVLYPKIVEPKKIVDSFISSNSVVVSYNTDKKVRMAFIAEHAGDALPEGYHWSANDSANIVSKGLHYDPFTVELANFLAHKFETSLIFTRLSKLLIDANCQLTCKAIFPSHVAGVPVELNAGITIDEETNRYEQYFLGLVRGIMYLHQRISSHFWFSIQSFPSELLPGTDVVISFYANDAFAKKVSSSLVKGGYSVTLNHPFFDGKSLFGYTNTTFLNGFYPRKRESLIFVFSSSLLASKLEKVKADMSELIKSCCLQGTRE